MQRSSFANDHRPTAPGRMPGAFGLTCAVTPLGEVRPYAPFGLMHLDGVEVGKRLESERRGEIEEKRGRTGLAA